MTTLHTQPGAAKTVADILAAAADLIAKPGAWTQGDFSRDDKGVGQHWSYDSAVCWCLAGAVYRAARPSNLGWLAIDAVEQDLGIVSEWNDAPNRTQAEVVAALRAAAEKARTVATNKPAGDAEGVHAK